MPWIITDEEYDKYLTAATNAKANYDKDKDPASLWLYTGLMTILGSMVRMEDE